MVTRLMESLLYGVSPSDPSMLMQTLGTKKHLTRAVGRGACRCGIG